MKFIGEYDKSVLLTYAGVAFSLFGIYATFYMNLKGAMMCLILAGICDLFDGVVARRMKRTPAQEAFGVEIDSLCDMISFAAFPAVFLMWILPFEKGNVVLVLLYVLAAVTRLAHFNRLAKGQEGSATHFIGLPVTYSALVFPLVFLFFQLCAKAWLSLGLAFAAIVLAVLFVWDVLIAKPNKAGYIGLSILAVVMLIVLGVL